MSVSWPAIVFSSNRESLVNVGSLNLPIHLLLCSLVYQLTKQSVIINFALISWLTPRNNIVLCLKKSLSIKFTVLAHTSLDLAFIAFPVWTSLCQRSFSDSLSHTKSQWIFLLSLSFEIMQSSARTFFPDVHHMWQYTMGDLCLTLQGASS